ncbi:MAG: CTP synthase (glutamine hydrolyzing) [Candidatus Diapherotrites archaeon]|nr:CTP synthase (glutamine hydrolyzing) [Candidatus Diapherotrites archaeon]
MRGEKLLWEASTKVADEFYTPMPKGYKKGLTKYLVITGSVMSGVGKGMITSSLCKLFQNRGMNVEPLKLEAYLNVDAGTLNPYRHGEVFVLQDGTETDMDLGAYERFLDKNLTRENFVTSGFVYKTIIEKERRGEYLGRDVQFIPHVTGEIKSLVRALASNKKPDIIVIEIGGTVGDYENMFAIEAMRELMYEEGKENVCFLNVTYIIDPPTLGEQKSKAAQLGIRGLLSLGIQPDLIICRSHKPLSNGIAEKISINSNVPIDRVIGLEDIKRIYELPLLLRRRGTDRKILESLGIEKKFNPKDKELAEWTLKNTPPKDAPITRIAIVGKYVNVKDAYISILKALEHCEGPLKTKISVSFIDAVALENGKIKSSALNEYAGVIVPGGFGKRGIEGKIMAAKYCLENQKPYLGLCLGFQVAAIAFARSTCGLKDANSTEFEPNCRHPVITLLPDQQSVESFGASMRLGSQEVELIKGTFAYKIHGKSCLIKRRFRHRYEFNPEYIEKFAEKGLVFSGKDPKKPLMQLLELPKHPFFMASQYHPEFTSRPLKPDPLFLHFVKKAMVEKC